MQILTGLSILASSLVALTAATPVAVAFSGNVATTASGFSLAVNTGSMCSVEYQNLQQLGVNCTVQLAFIAPNKWDYTATLIGGVNLVPVNGNLQAQLNYQAILPNVVAGTTFKVPSAGGSATVAIPYVSTINVNTPLAICITNVTQYLPTLDAAIAQEILSITGSNVCLNINFASTGNQGASLSIVLNVDLLDSTVSSSPNLLNDALTLAGVSKNVPIKYSLNIGASINTLLTQGTVTSPGRRMRGLAPTASYLDSTGNFKLGTQPMTAGAVAGITIGVVALVGVTVGAVVIIRKRRTTHL